ncbi:MAG: hypothetical protein HY360_02485 [Verrucomicrobia bacterium]|nr:hypothetical protein [Verrucomicrobiota bacterium]
MNKQELLSYLEQMDRAMENDATLCVYGSAAFILMDEPERISVDIDVAAPYSQADFVGLQKAAAQAGLPINPDEMYSGDHIEWVPALRLCLPKPDAATEMLLWAGRRLRVKTVALPQLIASKLIRYDSIDRADVQYVCQRAKVEFSAIAKAAGQLPPPFDCDSLVRENLESLKSDLNQWLGGGP